MTAREGRCPVCGHVVALNRSVVIQVAEHFEEAGVVEWAEPLNTQYYECGACLLSWWAEE